MNTVRAIQKLNKRELEAGISPEGSWHTDYRDTAFIYVGGLPFELSEGDIITLFSQYGEPVWIKLARDKETGKSRGFCWLKYEDQRSTDLAVDNLGGAQVLGRTLRVDHTRYKPRDDEDMRDNTMGDIEEAKEPEKKRRRRRRGETESESESEEERPLLKEEVELRKLIRDLDDDDPMKGALVKRKREAAEAAVAKYEKARRKEKERSRRRERHRDGSRDGRRDTSRDRQIGRRRDESTHRDATRHRARPKDRHRDRSGDRDGERRRQRSRDRDDRRRSRSRDHRSQSREHHDRRRDRSKSSDHDSDRRRGDRD